MGSRRELHGTCVLVSFLTVSEVVTMEACRRRGRYGDGPLIESRSEMQLGSYEVSCPLVLAYPVRKCQVVLRLSSDVTDRGVSNE